MHIRFHACDRHGHHRFWFDSDEEDDEVAFFEEVNASVFCYINLPDGPARFRIWTIVKQGGVMHIELVRAVGIH